MNSIKTVRDALVYAEAALKSVSDEAHTEARELVSFAAGYRVRRGDTSAFDERMLAVLKSAIARRAAHEPLQHIIGEWDFMGLTFFTSRDALIPRQDTETLAETAEESIKRRGYKTLLDICTGTGCIGVALNKRTGIETTLSDISEPALALAKRNAERNGADCRIVKSDLFAAFEGERFDLITANPPYIRREELGALQPEVRFEPTLALDGGEDGLAFYRRIAAEYGKHLNDGGALIMEIGFDQGESVEKLFAPFGKVRRIKDIAGLDRVVTVMKKENERMLIIKQTERADLENTRRLWADGEVMKFVGFPNGLIKSAGDMEKWLASIEAHRPKANHFSIYEGENYCGEAFYAIDGSTGRAALDIKLFPAARGRGVGRSGLIHAIKAAFANGARSVYVDPNPENERAIRLYEGVGMIKKPTPEELKDDEYPNFLYYELTKEEFKESSPKE